MNKEEINMNLDNIFNNLKILIKLKNETRDIVSIIKIKDNNYNIHIHYGVKSLYCDYDIEIINKNDGCLMKIIYFHLYYLSYEFAKYLDNNNFNYEIIEKEKQQVINTNINIYNEQQLIKILNDLFISNNLYLKAIK